MQKRTLLIGCALLSACSDGAVKEAIKDRLIDPESVQFGRITFSPGGNDACAEVNAKNRMGGYTGRKQVQLRKLDGDWDWVSDSEESHTDCVERINNSDNPQASASVDSADGVGNAVHLTPPSPRKAGVVSLVATAPAWLQITDAGKTLFSGELAPGQWYEVPEAAVAPELKAAKLEAIRVFVGEKEVGRIGEPGRVVSEVSLKASDLVREGPEWVEA